MLWTAINKAFPFASKGDETRAKRPEPQYVVSALPSRKIHPHVTSFVDKL